MNFEYADYFGQQPSTGYERLLHDCMIGDQTLFQRADMVEAGWCVVSPVLDVWRALPPRNFPNYAVGHMGTKGSRRTARTRWPSLEEFREMILAGDIGGTHARLAYFESQNGQLSPGRGIASFPAANIAAWMKSWRSLLRGQSVRPTWLASALPVRSATAGSKLQTYLGPWTPCDSPPNCRSPTAMLINDLEANAWGIASLGEDDLVPLNRVKGTPIGNQAVISAGTGLGEAGLTGMERARRFCLRRRPL